METADLVGYKVDMSSEVEAKEELKLTEVDESPDDPTPNHVLDDVS